MEKQFEYNDEFFFKEDAKARAQAEFPKIWFALYSEKINSTFRDLDEQAKALKYSFQKWGLFVVLLAVAALTIAVLEPAYIHPLSETEKIRKEWAHNAVAGAALAGLLSIFMGYFGMGIGARKKKWLHTRLVCERIRQWRWQYFCAHLPEAIQAAGDPAKEKTYATERDRQFAAYVSDLQQEGDKAVGRILDASADLPNAAWIGSITPHMHRAELAAAVESVDPSTTAGQAIKAYDKVRIGGQWGYADYLVKGTGPFRTHPATQLAKLHKLSTFLIFAVFALHAVVLIGVWKFPDAHGALKSMHVAAVTFALFALGIRAIEDGLRPAEHLGRFKGYLAEVSSIGDAFKTASNGAERRNQMLALEKAAYKEMVDFIRAGNRSRYVM